MIVSQNKESIDPHSQYSFGITYGLVLSLIFALALSYSFLNLNAYWLAWIAYVPLLLAVQNSSFKQTILIGLIGGVALFVLGTYWMVPFIERSKGFDTYQALMTASVVWLYCAGSVVLQVSLFRLLKRYTSVAEVILFPAVIASTLNFYPMMFEMHLANTQVFFPLALQLLPVVGIMGVDALIALVNILIFIGIRRIIGLTGSRRRVRFDRALVVAAAGLVLMMTTVSVIQFTKWDKHSSPLGLRIGIIQPNESPEIGKNYQPLGYSMSYPPEMETSHKLAAEGADLIIWPEGRRKHYLDDPRIARSFHQQVDSLDTALLFQDFKNLTQVPDQLRHNAAVFIQSNSLQPQIYNKRELIPFGESVPDVFASSMLSTVFKSLMGEFFAEIKAGDSFASFSYENIQIVPLICFETTKPSFVNNALNSARHSMQEDSQPVLVALSNDGWFGSKHQARQHIYSSALRAIENRTPLLHVVNNGPSIFVTPSGRITKLLPEGKPGSLLVDL